MDLAPNSVFCLQKRDVYLASHLKWGGSLSLEPSGYVQTRTRKAFSHSHGSNDSGYESGDTTDTKILESTQIVGGFDNKFKTDMSYPFFIMGRLIFQIASDKFAKTSDYIVAVSLYDE